MVIIGTLTYRKIFCEARDGNTARTSTRTISRMRQTAESHVTTTGCLPTAQRYVSAAPARYIRPARYQNLAIAVTERSADTGSRANNFIQNFCINLTVCDELPGGLPRHKTLIANTTMPTIRRAPLKFWLTNWGMRCHAHTMTFKMS